MDSRLFLEFLQHSDKKPRTIRPRKDLLDHFDDENEAVGTGRHTSRLRRASKLHIFIDITLLLQHQSACRRLFFFNDVTNYAIGLGQGHASL